MMCVEDVDLILVEAEKELTRLDSLREGVAEQMRRFRQKRGLLLESVTPEPSDFSRLVTTRSLPEHKIVLFMSLYRGRADVFPRRFESQRAGKRFYQPVCKNEWIKGLCRKPNSVGTPPPFSELRITDENNQKVPVGTTGEICCRSPHRMLGYYKRPDLTREGKVDG